MNAPERRAIPESRIEELRKLARSTDEAERRVAALLLAQIDAVLTAREEAKERGDLS